MISLLFLPLIFFSPGAVSHESWVLSPEETAEWNARPVPEVFRQLNHKNFPLYMTAALFFAGWILLSSTGGRKWFEGLQGRLTASGRFAGLALRWTLAILLFMAAAGLCPRHGTGYFEAPTLVAPDLELRLLGPGWEWIAWIELALAACFFLGIYVRGAASVLLGLGLLGLFLFGEKMAAYLGLLTGGGIYLLLRGAETFYISLPGIGRLRGIQRRLADEPPERAQWFLRILTGLNLVYLGLAYKFLQPNLMVAIIKLHSVPTGGLEPATFVLGMALVETLSGALIVAGVLIRPLAVILFGAFLFFSVILGESVLSHIIFYGLLAAFLLNGAGQWRRPPNPSLARESASR